MDTKLKTHFLYAIADALGLTISYDRKSFKLSGGTDRDVMFGAMRIPFGVRIVSSHLAQDQYLVMAKVMGNLGLLIVSGRDGGGDFLSLYLLNQAKLDSFTGWLEKHRPANKAAALKLLGAAVVKSFDRIEKNRWKQAA